MKRPPSERRLGRRRVAGRILSGAGVLAAVTGSWLVGAYVERAVRVLGSSDRSWLFWGLALLFAGVLLIGAGAALVLLGRHVTRSAAPEEPPG
jgi:hypothetical protein